jgi:hypothetical protein
MAGKPSHCLRIGWLLTLVGAVGCSAIVDANPRKLGPSPVPCDAKAKPAECLCPDGSTSTQSCNALGRYDPCKCAGAAGRGG